MLRKAAAALAVGRGLTAALAGCASGSNPGSGGSSAASGGGSGKAGGLIPIVVNDPSNPYWLTEGNVASAQAKKLGYKASVQASKGDVNTESSLLDPANADGSVGNIKRAMAAKIPVFLVNAEINQTGVALGQLVSNNAQGASVGAQAWVKAAGTKGDYA